MRTVIIMTTFMLALVSGLMAQPARAEDFQNVSTFVVVNGRIYQVVRNNGQSELNIGTVTAENGTRVRNVKTQVRVDGDIDVGTRGGRVKVDIGSVHIKR